MLESCSQADRMSDSLPNSSPVSRSIGFSCQSAPELGAVKHNLGYGDELSFGC